MAAAAAAVAGLVAACHQLRDAVENSDADEFPLGGVAEAKLREMNESVLWVLSQGFGGIGIAPVVANVALPQQQRAAMRSDRRYSSPADVKILVCDDDMVFSAVLGLRLRSLGFDVKAVSSGGDAIRELL